MFYVITSGYMFRLYPSHLQAEVLFTDEGDIYNWQYCCRLRDLALHILNAVIKIICTEVI